MSADKTESNEAVLCVDEDRMEDDKRPYINVVIFLADRPSQVRFQNGFTKSFFIGSFPTDKWLLLNDSDTSLAWPKAKDHGKAMYVQLAPCQNYVSNVIGVMARVMRYIGKEGLEHNNYSVYLDESFCKLVLGCEKTQAQMLISEILDLYGVERGNTGFGN